MKTNSQTIKLKITEGFLLHLANQELKKRKKDIDTIQELIIHLQEMNLQHTQEYSKCANIIREKKLKQLGL